MSKNKFFRFPYGYIEEKGFESKKSQLKDLLEDNVEVDGMQTKKIESNTAAINAEVERSSSLDEKFGKELEEEISERKRMGSILNDKLSKVENDVKGLVGNTSDAFDSVAESLKAVDEELKAKDKDLESKINDEISRAKSVEQSLQKSTDELNVRLGKEINSVVESNILVQEALNTERNLRETRDSELNAKINVEMAERIAAIESERMRAESKENEISSSLDSRIATINSNMVTLTNSVSKVNTLIDDEIKRAKSEESSLKSLIDSESEKNAMFQELMSNELTFNVSELKSKDEVLETKLNEEISRAKKEEEFILNKVISTEKGLNDRLSVNSEATNIIETRVTSAENKLNNIFLTSTNELEYVLYVGGIPKGSINIPKDNFLKDVKLVNDDLMFTFIADGVEKTLPVNIGQYVDVYTAGEGLSVSNYQFKIKIDGNSESYLKTSSEGLKLEGINSSISSAIANEVSRVDNIIASVKTSVVNEGAIRSKSDEHLETLILDESRRASDAEDKLNTKIFNIEPKVLTVENGFKVLNNEITNVKTSISHLEEVIEEVRSEIPSLEGYATEELVSESVSDKVTETELTEKLDELYGKVETLVSESVNDKVTNVELTEKFEELEVLVSESVSDKVTEEKLNEKLTELETLVSESVSDKVSETELTEKIGELETLISESVSDKVSETELEDRHYATLEYVNAQDDKKLSKEMGDLLYAPIDNYVTENVLTEKLNKVYSDINLSYSKEFEMIIEIINDLQAKIDELESKMYFSEEISNKVKSMKEGDTLNLKLFNDITFDIADKLTIPQNSVVNLDMNGKMISGNFDDILFRVNGTLNIYGNGQFQGSTYVASVNENGTVNVYDGSFNNEVTSFQANGGVINIEGGKFESYSEVYGAKYTLNHIDAKKNVGLISVKGGTFVNYNPAASESENPVMNFLAEGYGVTISYTLDNKPVYNVIPQKSVKDSEELINLISSLDKENKTYITLSNDLIFDGDEKVTIDGKLDLNLNGKTIKYTKDDILFRVNGELTISGGKVISDGYVASANEGSRITVLDGEYEGSVTCFQSNGGILNVKGGHFSSCNDTYGCKYTLNFIDSKKNIGQIIVEGGAFVGYNPAESESENPVMNFLAEGYKSVETIEDGITIYVVVKE